MSLKSDSLAHTRGKLRVEMSSQSPSVLLERPDRLFAFHFGRSGSTVIAKMLQRHPQISWLDELLTLRDQELAGADRRASREQLLDYINDKVEANSGPSKLFVGFEIKLINFLQNPAVNFEDLARSLSESERYQCVTLRRRNTLHRVVSSLKATQSKVYHIKAGDSAKPPTKSVALNLDHLIDYDTGVVCEAGDRKRGKNLRNFLAKVAAREVASLGNLWRIFPDALNLTYEDHVRSDPTVAYRKITSWLGIEAGDPEIELAKTGGGLERDLENFQEVKNALTGSEFAWMIED